MVRIAPRLAAGLTIQALAVLLVGCSSGSGGNEPSPPPPPPVTDTTPPTVPSGVTAVAQTPTQIIVSWTASTDAGTGVAGYRVYRDGSTVALSSVTTNTYTDNAVVANTLYSYTVRAFDAATPPNESALSNLVSATTPPAPVVDNTPPTVPAGVTAVAQSSSRIQVSWTASTDASGISGYRVYRNGGATPVATVRPLTTPMMGSLPAPPTPTR